jgi:hypothetical protein
MTGRDLFGDQAPPAPALTKKSAMHGESGYERAEHDFYETREAWITRALLKRYPLEGPVWECACGRLAMAKILAEHFTDRDVIASDIADHFGDEYPELLPWVRLDFLGVREMLANGRGEAAHAIVTNPPYDLADRFARKALELTRPAGGQVALLLRNEWDSLTRRPRWSDEDKASPRHNFAWFVWDWRAKELRRMAWGP